MKKTLLALLLVAALLMTMLAGCGNSTAAASASEAAAEESTAEAAEPAAAEEAAEETPADEAPAEEAPAEETASAEEAPAEEASAEETGYEPAINFPGSDTARLHYSNEYTLPISEDGMTVTWMRNGLNLMGALGELGLNTLQDLDAIQYLQEITGVTIEYTELDFWTSQEKMNVAIASGDYADIISDLSYTGGATGALADEVIVDLTDLLPEYSPNYQYLIDSNPDEAAIFRNDGLVLCYQSPYENFVQNQGLVIRKDWLEEQGLDIPTTYDQMTETLKVFRDAYNTTTSIYFNQDCVINGLLVGYDVCSFSAGGSATSLPYYVVDGEVHCTLIEDGYKDYLLEMNEWYNEGLFDKNFGSIQYDPMGGELAELTANGTVGVWCTSGEGIGNIEQEVSCVPNLVQNEGDYDHLTSTSLVTDSTDTYITTCCDNVEDTMRFLDYLYSEDGILFYNYGFEGIDYELDENNTPQFTDAVVNNEYGVDVPNMTRIRCPYTLCSSLMILYRTAEYNTDLKNEAWEVWSSNMDGAYYIPSNVTMNEEETEASSYYVADIVTYASQMVPQFIAGDVDIEAEWDTFVAQLKEMSIESCIEAEQSAYDRCMG